MTGRDTEQPDGPDARRRHLLARRERQRQLRRGQIKRRRLVAAAILLVVVAAILVLVLSGGSDDSGPDPIFDRIHSGETAPEAKGEAQAGSLLPRRNGAFGDR